MPRHANNDNDDDDINDVVRSMTRIAAEFQIATAKIPKEFDAEVFFDEEPGPHAREGAGKYRPVIVDTKELIKAATRRRGRTIRVTLVKTKKPVAVRKSSVFYSPPSRLSRVPKVGTTVEAQDNIDGAWYSGVISHHNKRSGTTTVRFPQYHDEECEYALQSLRDASVERTPLFADDGSIVRRQF